MTRKPAVEAPRKELPKAAVFPPVFMEALAYHESGHAVMAVLLDVPMTRIVIGPACDDPDFNGKVELDLTAADNRMQVYKSGLIHAASEASEQLAPNHDQFGTLHKTYKQLKPFSRGLKADRIHGFNAVATSYYLLGVTQGTALKMFKRDYRDLAHLLFDVPVLRDAVHRLAGVLLAQHKLSGIEARTVILSEGPLTDGGLLAKWHFPPHTPAEG
jgi:hypothetical protein